MPTSTDMRGRFTDAAAAREYILGGHGRFTLASERTGARYTYAVRRPRSEASERPSGLLFISLLTGPDNDADYTYLGIIESRSGLFRLTSASKMNIVSPPVRALDWTLRQLAHGILPPHLAIWHEGICARCGRALTVPKSIADGLGPICRRRRASA